MSARFGPRVWSPEGDALVLVPRDRRRTGTRLQRIERAVRWLWSRGIYPGPAALTLRLHGRARRDLNGIETKVRNRLLVELGIGRQRRAAR